MAIYLIRHGETPGNRDRIVQLPATPLSERGLEQAERLADRLSGHPVRRILASDLARADMTAQALSRRLDLPVQPEPLLQERNFGDLRGTPYAQLEEDLFGPAFAPPGGETWEDFHERVDLAWAKIQHAAQGLEGHLAVVTHGLVLHSLVGRHLAGPGGAEGAWPCAFGNTCLTVVEPAEPATNAAGTRAWRIALLGCTEHLEGEGGNEGISGI